MINRLTGKDEKSVKVVIEILEDDYKNLMLYKDHSDSRSWAEIAIINGIPLPKGHGRLIDADALLRKHPEFDTYPFPSATIDNAPIIIEADKESEDKE